ncbi:hypothetical protein Tco_0136133, partial [Tanacetum coccineum]
MATTENLDPPGAGGNGPTISISHWEKGHADVMGVNFCFGFLALMHFLNYALCLLWPYTTEPGVTRSFPESRYSLIGTIQFSPSSLMMPIISFASVEFSCSTSTKTSLASFE